MPGTVHPIVIAVNNPSPEQVDSVIGTMSGEGWKAIWCADRDSLKQLPPAEHRISHVVLGWTGSLTMQDIAPHICENLRDVAAYGPRSVKHSFGFTDH